MALVIFTLIALNLFQNSFAQFCYEEESCGPATWGGVCQTGKAQSPINFDDVNTPVKLLRPIFHEFYAEPAPITSNFLITHTGHSVEVFFPLGAEPMLKGPQIALPRHYHFVQLHFHWGKTDDDGTEHKIGGKGSALELHLVHHSSSYNSFTEASAAANDPNAIAIFGVLFEIGPDDNPALKSIVDALPLARHYDGGKNFTVTEPIDMTDLYPYHLDFYRYEGSLTTPSCSENHVWTVFKHKNKISEAQMAEFRKTMNEEGTGLMNENHRPVQPRNGRPITFYQVPRSLEDWEEIAPTIENYN